MIARNTKIWISAALLALSTAALMAADTAPVIKFGGPVGLKYVPDSLTVKAGTTVTWEGSFSVHPLISDEKTFPDKEEGTRFEFKFENPGTFHYHCGRHGVMTGVVQVTAE